MQHVLRKVKVIEDTVAKSAKRREAVLEGLERAQQRLDEKERELRDCQQHYDQVTRRLDDKKKLRQELRAEIEKFNKDMSSLVKGTLEQQRAASYWAKEL